MWSPHLRSDLWSPLCTDWIILKQKEYLILPGYRRIPAFAILSYWQARGLPELGVTCRVTLVHPEMGETLREVALWGICFLLLLGFFPGAKRLGGGSGQMQHIMAVFASFCSVWARIKDGKKSGTSLPFCYSSAMGSFLSGQRQALESDESSESESSGCWRTVPQVFVLQFHRWKS